MKSDFMDLERGKALGKALPMAFVASPSAKDPNWRNHPERVNKSNLTVITGASYDWFRYSFSLPLRVKVSHSKLARVARVPKLHLTSSP